MFNSFRGLASRRNENVVPEFIPFCGSRKLRARELRKRMEVKAIYHESESDQNGSSSGDTGLEIHRDQSYGICVSRCYCF